ncbi:MAG: glucuronate isomerase [Flavobacteriaceae bacterium]|nr:glucuronate isomerase [Flavobacteriaceae bacterium]
MKNNFIKHNFLLNNKYAEELYHTYASKMPIIDYHCHLSPKDIAEDRIFKNITEVWIHGDHYKWRAMRTLGIDEKYITGDASDLDKFRSWAKTVPYTLRNPLYHWTHLELLRYFDIDELLTEDNADIIYKKASDKLNSSEFSCQKLLAKMNVEVVCTTEDPIDNLEYHQMLAKSDAKIKMSTSFRPDKSILIEDDSYNDYLNLLEKASGIAISTYDDLEVALKKRVQYFNENGCKLSDHGLSNISCVSYMDLEVKEIFNKRRNNKAINHIEIEKFKSAILQFLAKTYHEFGWVQQFHVGALRNNNKRMLQKLGPDTGWDSIGDFSQAETLSKFLNLLDSSDQLTKTILYNLNPADNEVMASMVGNFNDGKIKGKVQFGSGWWFLDQKDGIIKQLNALSNMSLISTFIGMLTDSRSFISYPRHEYFRRILCNLFGEEIEKGELPNDMEWIGKIISDICYTNAKEYFNFK